jgi:hypothetical protein
MRTKILGRLARRAQRRRSVQQTVPAWALEDTQEVAALRRVNRETAWAAESTGLLSALSAGLRAMDRHAADKVGEGGVPAGGAHWVCRSGEAVTIGDLVALRHGASSDVVGRIIGGTAKSLRCVVVSGSALPAGVPVIVTVDQLLVKVSSR